MPPTPTMLPPGVPHFEIPAGYSLWGSTDLAIHTWNWLGAAQMVIQALAIIMLVIAGMYILTRAIQMATRKDSEE